MKILPIGNYQIQNQNSQKRNQNFGMVNGKSKTIARLNELERGYSTNFFTSLGDFLQEHLNTYLQKGRFEITEAYVLNKDTHRETLLGILERYKGWLRESMNVDRDTSSLIMSRYIERVEKMGDELEIKFVEPSSRKLTDNHIVKIQQLISRAKDGNTLISEHEQKNIDWALMRKDADFSTDRLLRNIEMGIATEKEIPETSIEISAYWLKTLAGDPMGVNVTSKIIKDNAVQVGFTDNFDCDILN